MAPPRLLAAAKAAAPGVGAPAALALLLIGERAADGAIPVWLAIVALEVIAVLGSAALFVLTTRWFSYHGVRPKNAVRDGTRVQVARWLPGSDSPREQSAQPARRRRAVKW